MLLSAVSAWLETILPSPITKLADRSWPDGKSSVYHVRDADDAEWFVKCHDDHEWFSHEVHAYHRWVGAIGDRAPRLRAHDVEHRVLVVSALRAEGPQDWHDGDVRRDAGMILRRLHAAESFGPFDDMAAVKHDELDRWLHRGGGAVTAVEAGIARACVRELAWLPTPDRVPCHHDYTPRNWVIDHRRVQVIDFEETYPDAWMSDIVRLTSDSGRTSLT